MTNNCLLYQLRFFLNFTLSKTRQSKSMFSFVSVPCSEKGNICFLSYFLETLTDMNGNLRQLIVDLILSENNLPTLTKSSVIALLPQRDFCR